MVSMVRYRLHTKGVFLTYPQCPAPREIIPKMLESKGLIVVKGIVGQECHQDGNLHLHAYVKFSKQIDTLNPRYFDIEYEGKPYHGKYEPAKSAIASIKYVSKHDKEPLELGDMDYKQEIVAKESKKKVLGKRLAGDEPLTAIMDDHPEMIPDYLKLKANREAYKRDKAREKPDCAEFIPNTWDLTLPITSEKKKHYWFWSDQPNKGKTTFLKSIDAQFRASWYTKAENFQGIYKDSQFILIDEFTTADIKATRLNEMCDGTFQFPVKGGEPSMCPAIILVCGNKDPEVLYPNAWQYLEARFNVINLNGVL